MAEEALPDVWREILHRVDAMGVDMAEIKSKVSALPTRAEYEAAISERVHNDTFQAEIKGINERITRLESGPQRSLGWISLATSGGIGCLSFCVALTGLVAAVILHFVH